MRIRPARFAGNWYPADQAGLQALLESALQASRARPGQLSSTLPFQAVLLPHAGLAYSSPLIMAGLAGFSQRPRPKRLILLAPSHYLPLDADHLYTANLAAMETPLGQLPAWALAHPDAPWEVYEQAIVLEHAVEMFLPGLKYLFPDIQVLAVIVPQIQSLDSLHRLAAAVQELLDEPAGQTALIASSDISHYGKRFDNSEFGTDYRQAAPAIRDRDHEALRILAASDPASFFRGMERLAPSMCGRYPALLLAEIARQRRWQGQQLGYYNSVESLAAEPGRWPRPVKGPGESEFVTYAGLAYLPSEENHEP